MNTTETPTLEWNIDTRSVKTFRFLNIVGAKIVYVEELDCVCMFYYMINGEVWAHRHER